MHEGDRLTRAEGRHRIYEADPLTYASFLVDVNTELFNGFIDGTAEDKSNPCYGRLINHSDSALNIILQRMMLDGASKLYFIGGEEGLDIGECF